MMNELVDLKYKGFKEILISIFVGFSIGLSVIVPGISGSAIAIIMKVYDKMMYAFSNIFKKFKLCFLFLIPIGIGIIAGFGIGFVLVRLLLDTIPFITICFFVGLMVGTFPILFKEIRGEKSNMNGKLLFVGGMLVPLAITLISMAVGADNSLVGLSVGHYFLFVFLGVLVSLTQIIPGLSATVLLMMFGYYSAILNGVGSELFSDFGLIMVYVCLVIGFVIGILLFSKIINKLLEKKRRPFFFTICGLSVGSMLAVFLGNECVDIYKTWQTTDMIIDLCVGIPMLIVGFGLTFALYIFDKKREEKKLAEEKN
ncbi:MAG: DUF368 domain-containing protein [Clostridia bacterium]|nr:DUF368 domain-containing protein [Clostridia bacterium]